MQKEEKVSKPPKNYEKVSDTNDDEAEVLYDPFKSPPNLKLARQHLAASRVNFEDKETNKFKMLIDSLWPIPEQKLEPKQAPEHETAKEKNENEDGEDGEPTSKIKVCKCCNQEENEPKGFKDFPELKKQLNRLGAGFQMLFSTVNQVLVINLLTLAFCVYPLARNILKNSCKADVTNLTYPTDPTLEGCLWDITTFTSLANYDILAKDSVERIIFIAYIVLYALLLTFCRIMNEKEAKKYESEGNGVEDWTVHIKHIAPEHTQKIFMKSKDDEDPVLDLDDYMMYMIDNTKMVLNDHEKNERAKFKMERSQKYQTKLNKELNNNADNTQEIIEKEKRLEIIKKEIFEIEEKLNKIEDKNEEKEMIKEKEVMELEMKEIGNKMENLRNNIKDKNIEEMKKEMEHLVKKMDDLVGEMDNKAKERMHRQIKKDEDNIKMEQERKDLKKEMKGLEELVHGVKDILKKEIEALDKRFHSLRKELKNIEENSALFTQIQDTKNKVKLVVEMTIEGMINFKKQMEALKKVIEDKTAEKTNHQNYIPSVNEIQDSDMKPANVENNNESSKLALLKEDRLSNNAAKIQEVPEAASQGKDKSNPSTSKQSIVETAKKSKTEDEPCYKVIKTNYVYNCEEFVILDRKLENFKKELSALLEHEEGRDKPHNITMNERLNPSKNKIQYMDEDMKTEDGKYPNITLSDFSLEFQIKYTKACFMSRKVVVFLF